MPKPPSQPNQSLIDGITVLQAVASSVKPISCVGLAKELGMGVTRVNRLLKTLEYVGIVRQNKQRKYLGGSGMHILAAQSLTASGLIRAAFPHLEKLQDTGTTIALGVYWRQKVTYLYHHTSGTASGDIAHAPYPAGDSSIGLVLLAQLDDEHLAAEFPDGIVPGYPGDFAQFMGQMREIRQMGYASIFHNHYNLAMPLLHTTGAAIAMTRYFDPSQTPDLLKRLRETVDAINQSILLSQ